MSARVMNCLEVLAPRVEQYSIDEMFLNLTGLEHCMGLDDFGRQLRQHVYDCTRLTIGVGAGPTKTLAKSAQWASKEWKQFRGVLALIRGNPQRTRKLLSLQPVEEIWGVGNLIARKLNMLGIKTALDLALTNPTFIRKNFSVVLERTVRELNGESCLSLEEALLRQRGHGETAYTHSGHRGHHCCRHNGSGAYQEGWAPVCQSRSYAE